ncbi:MAG: hypothetical protein IT160_14240 [Bryobacterales bacterium]|nr:hypothetical protein [Bryobacterales bacterium]
MKLIARLALLLSLAVSVFAAGPLQLSVFAEAGDVKQYLSTAEGRQDAATRLKKLHITGIYLESRLADTYVPPEEMKPIRDFFLALGFRVSAGTVNTPGQHWGVRQKGPLLWLNYQAEKTQRDIRQTVHESASVFDEIIIDDDYCTEDTSPESEAARAGRGWGQYRRDLLVSLLQPMIFHPARQARPGVKLILKYPQWYDRFHLFGYDPARMSIPFDRIWVGTEVRNPQTKRMGYVQPTEGYINFRWVRDVAGPKTVGAWFDHIDCTAQNFIDQAWQSVLAGADELTLFHLSDIMKGHPGHALLMRDWDALVRLHQAVAPLTPAGVPYYKPVNSDGDGNMWLMDYLAMIGIPVMPVSAYPAAAKSIILGVQASADPNLMSKIEAHLNTGATIVVTPALLRKLGSRAARLSGVALAAACMKGQAGQVNNVELTRPLEVDLSVQAPAANVKLWATAAQKKIPYMAARRAGKGTIITWNVRTFDEADYTANNERLLAPAQLGLPVLPQPVADAIREPILTPLGLHLSAPAGVGFYLFGTRHYFYNFQDHPVTLTLNTKPVTVHSNTLSSEAGTSAPPASEK